MARRAFRVSTLVESRRRTAGCNVMLQATAGDAPHIAGIAGAMDTAGIAGAMDTAGIAGAMDTGGIADTADTL
jgi:hypothetical protein